MRLAFFAHRMKVVRMSQGNIDSRIPPCILLLMLWITDRYLLVEDGHAIHRMASQAAYDCPVVLVDSRRYGGGAICLDNCVTTAHHQLSPQVFVHEFGHALAYLADEYVGAVSYKRDFIGGGRTG